MQIPLYDIQANEVGKVELSDRVFGAPLNKDLLYQVVTSQLSNKRQVIAHTKGRGEVRGGGKKPWQQKGTGRARHGSIRSPIWKGGGVTFGPTKERNFKKKINRKMLQKALAVALSSKLRDGNLFVIQDFNLEKPKTKAMAVIIKQLGGLFGGKPDNILLVAPEKQETVLRASKNLPSLSVTEARNLNPLRVLESRFLILPQSSVPVLEKRLL